MLSWLLRAPITCFVFTIVMLYWSCTMMDMTSGDYSLWYCGSVMIYHSWCIPWQYLFAGWTECIFFS